MGKPYTNLVWPKANLFNHATTLSLTKTNALNCAFAWFNVSLTWVKHNLHTIKRLKKDGYEYEKFNIKSLQIAVFFGSRNNRSIQWIPKPDIGLAG